MIEERGLYIERWLPERRSRRRPLYCSMASWAGSWVWERYLQYFAQRGWEGHALNLRAHFWSETADFEELDLDTLRRRRGRRLRRPGPAAVVVGHGMGGLLALKARGAARGRRRSCCSARGCRAHPPRVAVPRGAARARRFRRELIGWAGAPDQIQRQNPDLSIGRRARVQHLMGAESGAARRQMLEGVAGRPGRARRRARSRSSAAGVDRLFPESTASDLPTGSVPSTSRSGRTPTTVWSSARRATSRSLMPSARSWSTIGSSRSTIRVRPHLGSSRSCYPPQRPAPHSSRGPGHRPLKAETTGSNPVCGTIRTSPTPPDRAPGAFFLSDRVRGTAVGGPVEKVVDKLVDDLLAPLGRPEVSSASPPERASGRRRRGGARGTADTSADH